jgi:hypothetical protein
MFDSGPPAAVQTHAIRDVSAMAETELGLVPEIYYDVIARLCAGAPFVALVFWAYPAMRALSAVALGLVAAFGGYLAGHLLAALSALWNPLLWNRFLFGRIISRLKLVNSFSSGSPTLLFHELYCRIDYISNRDSNGGAILKKMEAGSQLSDNLLSGFLVAVATRYFFVGGLTAKEALLAWALGVVLLVSVVLRRIILVGRQDSLYTLLRRENDTPPPVTT